MAATSFELNTVEDLRPTLVHLSSTLNMRAAAARSLTVFSLSSDMLLIWLLTVFSFLTDRGERAESILTSFEFRRTRE